MRIAFLADIHANLEALQACLADVRARGVERLVFLGDIVGYGADPVACVDIVGEACGNGAIAVKGNHDEACIGPTRFRLNETAERAVRWTEATLGDSHKAFLANLPMMVGEEGRLYVHASAAKAESYPYVTGLDDAVDSLQATKAQITLCGHVHMPALYNLAVTGKIMQHIPVAGMDIPLLSQRRWLAVMGAVGQPRDGNPAAAYGIFDTDKSALTFVRVPYDVETAQAKIRKAGLPDSLWKRLAAGR
jgi:diadenosine tetraphosphatase ApaH/serine/threonine PP2A family protein phosphatase